MKRWNILLCCILLVLGVAVFQKHREVSGLREKARPHLVASGGAEPIGPTKPHGERPEKSSDEGFEEDEENELIAGMSAFRPDGGLSEEAIKRLGLTQAEATAANEVMHQFRTEAETDLAQRLKPTAKHSEDGRLHQGYYARARRDRGQAPFDELTLALGSVVGQDRSRRLMKAFTHGELSARLCRLDLELEVVQPAEEGKEVWVSYELRSPRDGKVWESSSGSSLPKFEQKFGKIFEVGEASAE
ncbi:hypothetical protein [Luteolibacter soli]|uniref:Uncharacterized protein n=1 Tax=Luteolibacter soli TaxID=3135280 RepID=A0ABU9AZ41_9BACT